MKAYIFSILFLTFFLIPYSTLKAQNPNPLMGTWEIRIKSGGIKGIKTLFPQGNGNYILFEKNGDYINLYKGKVTGKGKFVLIHKKAFTTKKMEDFIQYLPSKNAVEFFKIKLDSLLVKSDFQDGYQYVYIRVNH